MSKKQEAPTTTVQIRLSPTPEQSRLLQAHCSEYIGTVNVLVSALDADMLHDGFSTKDFRVNLPSAVKNQALRDAHSVFKRALTLGTLPVLKKPMCQWNNQNWQMTADTLTIPLCVEGKVCSVSISCHGMVYVGKLGILRLKKKRGKWIAEIALTLPEVLPVESELAMGVDLGIKVPAVSYTPGIGGKFFGNGRYQRAKRRQFYARRKKLQKAKKARAIRKAQGKEARWMRNINHQLSRQIVNHAQAQGVGVIRLETLTGIRQGTTRKSRGAKARKNNRMMATWSFYQLTRFITYKSARVGIRVEQVDPAYTSQICPACSTRNKVHDRTYVCRDCGWMGHRDLVGGINLSRRTSVSDKRRRATGA